jgi:putative ABC transport system substrate-binding protein
MASGVGRRELIAAVSGVAAIWLVPASAQQPTTSGSRIGWLATGDPTTYRFSLAAFREGLQALGYIEGQNIAIKYRWAEGDAARLPELANELVQQKVDIILAAGSSGALAAKKATSLIPIVAAGAGDLVELGLVANLARPGGNLTGFVSTAPETAAKRVQIMTAVSPQVRGAAILWNSGNSNSQLEWKIAKKAAAGTGLTFTPYDAHTVNDVEDRLAAISQSHAEFLMVLDDPLMFFARDKIIASVGKSRLPAIYGFREFVNDGGLISYGSDISASYRRAALYIDKILRGAKPADLPVDLPTKFELLINLKTAKALGLTISPNLIATADEVIE